MASLAHILDRFRRIRLAPGPVPWAAAVPTRTVDPAEELAPLLSALDEIADDVARVVAAAHAAAARVEADARERARDIDASARDRAEREATAILEAAEARSRAESRSIDARARAEARAIRARARERESVMAQRVLAGILETPR